MKALIIGAGVCGPVTALALRRAGIESVVYEAHEPATSDVGSYLTVATNGLDDLATLDLHRGVLDAGLPTPQTMLLSGSGKPLGVVPIGSTTQVGPCSRTIKRAHLHRALYEAAALRGIDIQYGKRLVAAESSADGVVARFDDGSS